LRVRFDFASYHEEWNAATLAGARPLDIYRTRQSFAPVATLILAEPLDFSFGADFARFRPPAGYAGASAKTESSNAVVSTLRYHRRWGSAPDAGKNAEGQDLHASYSIRAGTRMLESDSAFTRHLAEVRYKFRRGRNTVEIGFMAGRILGAAPLFERFSAGNSVILRGWDKYQLDPLGASHIVHGSIDYTWRGFLAFYDTGAVWDRAPEREQKQSVGCGYKAKDGFQIAMAFPVRTGRAIPMFYAGLNF
jgi:outer membrane translocation and assembly module TamA